MKKAFLLIISSLLVTSPLNSQVYKIVDADGNVTFSQIEPVVKKDEKTLVESVDISVGNSGMSRVKNTNGNSYCGDIRLPSKGRSKYSSKYFSRNVSNSKENWQNSLARLGDRVKKTSQYNVKYNNNSRIKNTYKSKRNSEHRKSIDRDNQRMRDLRCAIDWANGQSGNIKTINTAQQTEKSRLIDIQSKLENSIERQCGPEPVYDPSVSSNKQKINKWNKCSRNKRRDLKKVERKLNRLH